MRLLSFVLPSVDAGYAPSSSLAVYQCPENDQTMTTSDTIECTDEGWDSFRPKCVQSLYNDFYGYQYVQISLVG